MIEWIVLLFVIGFILVTKMSMFDTLLGRKKVVRIPVQGTGDGGDADPGMIKAVISSSSLTTQLFSEYLPKGFIHRVGIQVEVTAIGTGQAVEMETIPQTLQLRSTKNTVFDWKDEATCSLGHDLLNDGMKEKSKDTVGTFAVGTYTIWYKGAFHSDGNTKFEGSLDMSVISSDTGTYIISILYELMSKPPPYIVLNVPEISVNAARVPFDVVNDRYYDLAVVGANVTSILITKGQSQVGYDNLQPLKAAWNAYKENSKITTAMYFKKIGILNKVQIINSSAAVTQALARRLAPVMVT